VLADMGIEWKNVMAFRVDSDRAVIIEGPAGFKRTWWLPAAGAEAGAEGEATMARAIGQWVVLGEDDRGALSLGAGQQDALELLVELPSCQILIVERHAHQPVIPVAKLDGDSVLRLDLL
jgi:hypothetical protein